MLRQEVQTADSRVLRPAAGQKHWFTPAMPRDNPATTVATCAGCATSWRGIGRAHCRACHATFDDEALFDAHRLTGSCVPPHHLDLVAVDKVWCRLLAG
jgi:hypothetical protein